MARTSKSNTNETLVVRKFNKADLLKKRKATERKREYRKKIIKMNSDKELKEQKSKRAENKKTRCNGKRAKMTLKEIQEDKSKRSRKMT